MTKLITIFEKKLISNYTDIWGKKHILPYFFKY